MYSKFAKVCVGAAVTMLVIVAHAETLSNQYFFGVGFLKARATCADLNIVAGDSLNLIAEDNRLEIDRIQNGQFVSLLSFSAPAQGQYVLRNAGAISVSDEFITPKFDIKKQDANSGDIIIQSNSAGSNRPCALISCPAFGPCE